jgi:hypothetical protein
MAEISISDEDMLLLRRFRSVQDAGYFGLNETATNTKTAMFELKLGTQPVGQGPHQLKAQPSICCWIEMLRETDAVVDHFHREGAVISGLATDMHLHEQSRRNGVFAGVGQKLSGNKPGMKRMTRIDMAIAAMVDGQVHLSVRAERSDHLGDFLQEIAKVYAIAVGRQRQ